MKKKLFFSALGIVVSSFSFGQIIESFDRIPLDSNSYKIASSPSDTLYSNIVTVTSSYDTNYGYWLGGFAISNVTDSTTSGYANLYGTKGYKGYKGTVNYLVGQQNARLPYHKKQYGFYTNKLKGFYINNSTYAYNSMRDGDGFSKKFGGATGNDPDYFLLTVKGYANGVPLGDSVDFYLSDYRFANNTQDYIVKDWTYVDVTSLSQADELEFVLTSSDMGMYGMNTPAFFCLDQLIFEDHLAATNAQNTFDDIINVTDSVKDNFYYPGYFNSNGITFDNNYDTTWNFLQSGWAVSSMRDTITQGFSNMYSAITGSGKLSDVYGVTFEKGNITTHLSEITGFYITNSAYTYYSMLNGDNFAKKFGGTSGNDPDYFKIIITRKATNNNPAKSMDFYLADYRFNNNEQDYIIKDWVWVDLSPLAFADDTSGAGLLSNADYEISFAGSDTGAYGLNTPKFACIDGIVTTQTLTSIKTFTTQTPIQISLYPNPAKDYIQLVSKETTFNQVNIYDVKGQLIKTFYNTNKFDINDIASGIYVIQAQGTNNNYSLKFIKQ